MNFYITHAQIGIQKEEINSNCFQLWDGYDPDCATHSVSMSVDWCVSYCSSKASNSSWLSENRRDSHCLEQTRWLLNLASIKWVPSHNISHLRFYFSLLCFYKFSVEIQVATNWLTNKQQRLHWRHQLKILSYFPVSENLHFFPDTLGILWS